MTEYMRTLHKEHGYEEISTPQMLSDELWKRSGHYAHYKDKMYFCNIDEQSYAIKPMNCPGSILIYKSRPRSYRELPLKLAEFGLVFRHELSGVLHGLMRVRSFTIDDAHIYCTPEQIEREVIVIINMVNVMLKKYGFENVSIAIATKPEKAMGSQELWEKATLRLKNASDQVQALTLSMKVKVHFMDRKSNFKYKIRWEEHGNVVLFKLISSNRKILIYIMLPHPENTLGQS